MEGRYKEIKQCRFCVGENLQSYLDLGKMPLVNSFVNEHQTSSEEKFPLEVLLCKDCYLSQLSIVVEPSILFRNYAYRSSISTSFQNHCNELAEELNQSLCGPGDLVLDIASNDGCLLKPFLARGNRVLGVDPAKNLAKIANEEGIETIPEFWNKDLAIDIMRTYGCAKVITAFNVFAHVHEIGSFTQGVKTSLAEDGFFIIESPHILDLIAQNEFDTIYHEHLSYLSVGALQKLMQRYGLRVARVQKQEIHGGSIRVYVEHETQNRSDGSVEKSLREEEAAGLYDSESYKNFRGKVEGVRRDLVSMVTRIKKEGKTIAAFGASAKGNILLNYSGIDGNLIDCVYDHTPEKQGKLTPGTHIRVEHPDMLTKQRPDFLLLTAWNFAAEIMTKTQDYKSQGGRYIIPIPSPRII
jgi:SAM-dependent methyltransferase